MVVGRWPLLGREHELARLTRLLTPDSAQAGVVVFGEAGVGKTRLVATAVERHREQGAAVEWVRATEAARGIPLGSFAHLFTRGSDVHSREDLLHLGLTRLHERAGGPTSDPAFVLAVDDAHLLDEASVALLHLAVTQASVRVLASVRTGEALPPGLAALWKDELLARLDLAPLSRDVTERLVLAVLGDGVSSSLLDRIWDLSRGNALLLRELVTAALERRADGRDGRIHLPGSPQDRLTGLVEERLRLLDPGLRAALEIVAVGEQVPLAAAEILIDPSDIEALEQRGLVEVAGTALGPSVNMAHPLYGEVVAASLPWLRRRALLRDLAHAVEQLDDPDRFDPLRLATWTLESGEPADRDQLLQLAREALGRLDHRLAERLAQAAGGVHRVDAGLVLGEALSGQGRAADAEAVLTSLRPSTPEHRARVAMAHASDLFLHRDRSAEAYDVLRAAADDLADHPRWQAECRSVLAQMLMFMMRLPEAGEIATELLAGPATADTSDTARVRAVTVAVTVWGAAGRIDDALALVDDDLYAVARRNRREVPYGDIQLRMARFQALYWAGRAHEIDVFTADDLSLGLDPTPASLRGVLSGFRGGALLLRGRAAAALAELQRSSRALAESDPFGQRPLAEAMRARAAVFAGELDVADEAIAAADTAFAADPQRGARTLPFIELSRAWLQSARGDVGEATRRCGGLAVLMEQSATPLAVEALHAVARLGHAADAVDGLERLAGVVDGPLAPIAARHARALVASDADELDAVVAQFLGCGCDLYAAEAARSAANLHRRAGHGARAATAAATADDILRACGHPRSPALEPMLPAGAELTTREREVALKAAHGLTSADIAAELFVSVRTVDTHLARVYRKLMISGRHELAAVLGVAPGSQPADT